MYISRIRLKNWRNFRHLDFALDEQMYIIGPNASGKSNLLDALIFLRDIARPSGGGLQAAVTARGGLQKIRCLHARNDPEVRIEVFVSEVPGSASPVWRYALGLNQERRGRRRSVVSHEEVEHEGARIVSRPSKADAGDSELLTQTALEQIAENSKFRELARFLSEIAFVHLVPQLLKYPDLTGGIAVQDDPYGQGFLERIARAAPRVRDARLRRIQQALETAVPQFKEIRFVRDDVSGKPHLEARYAHHRPNAGWQREDSFSDGTLRLIALLWMLQEGSSVLQLEEPELSLNDAVVREIPALFKAVRAAAKRSRQVIATTHSDALLSNPGISSNQVLILEVGAEGTTGRLANEGEQMLLDAGLSPAEVLLPKTRAAGLTEFSQWQ
ncbi:chromosome segregation protein SMC [Tersicoccus solisilvae]|uniref:Chromosome segregation protein SMC n=1 Tax=Tersicoccus solisilvae TaxID=1882339 RepID=A0ABQ1P8J5_9MICC|nr:ATP-binding protein [Tersicoccus solisilvae]GGC91223.1 chromosome segregation protein SMC [Tersicoccus solisilvae]